MRLHRTRRFASVFANACSVEPMEVRVLLSSTFHRDGHVAIIAKHDALGGENGVLGRYASGAIVTADGKGVYKYFSNGFIVWSPATGAHEVHGKIFVRYKELGGPNGQLGLPISDELLTRNSDGRINAFERGMIAFPLGGGAASAIYGNIAWKYYRLGGAWGFLGFPTSNEISVPSKNYRMNSLKGGIIVASPVTGIHEVHGAILNRYNELGGPSGILGLPISDEMNTPKKDGRISKFQFGTIVYIWGAEKAVETVTLPRVASIDVLTPPTFREGDVFTATVMNGIPDQWAYVQVIGDGNTFLHQFPAKKVDANGNATFALYMPYVLARGRLVDGFTLRVKLGPVTKDFPVGVNEGQRVSLSTDNIHEGQNVSVGVKNGVGGSRVIIQLTKDNNEVVHEWGNLQTDGSGKGSFDLTIPTVLTNGSRSDAFGLRVIHAGLVNDQRIVITEGFRVELGHQKTREGHTFPMGIRNAPENAKVRLEWYLDGSKRATQTDFKTNGDGEGNFTVTTPKILKGGAQEDKFEIQISIEGNSTLFVFGMLVKKQTGSSDPGGSQVKSAGPTPNKVNSALGILFNTPAEQGKKNARIIEKKENPVLAPKDPNLTVQERMNKQLVILCYGAGQVPGENANSANDYDKPGFDSVYKTILGTIAPGHILRLQSGIPTPDPVRNLTNAHFASADAKSAITSQINWLAEKGHNIESVIIVGFSWGGGMASEFATWITSRHSVQVSGLVYVDAVNHGRTGHHNSLPKTKSFLNIYQDDFSINSPADTFAWGDGSIPNPGLPGYDGGGYYGRYREFDVDRTVDNRKENKTSHTRIDNDMNAEVSAFIVSVLNGWPGI